MKIMATNPHYGGTITKGGRIGHKPKAGVQFKTEVMLEKLVRFDLAKAQGAVILDEDLARIFGRSQRYLNVIRKQTAYLSKRMELATGIPTTAEKTVELTTARYKQYLIDLMPSAMRVFADTLCTAPKSIAEKRLQIDLAKEVLDREGSFPKISRTDSHLKIEHDFGAADGISKELLESMDGEAQPGASPSIIEAIEANVAFTNSDTLSSSKQEKAMKMLELAPTLDTVN
jgi:hypothetical protein